MPGFFRVANYFKCSRNLTLLETKSRNFCSNPTKNNIINKWKLKLQNENVEDAEFSIRCILAHVLNKKFNTINLSNDYNLTAEQSNNFERLCECRLVRMPLQYIIGEWDFRDITLKLTPTVFIPRPETEGLVSLILQSINPDDVFRFIEIGCGSGAICLSLLKHLPKSKCVALDRSKMACKLTEENSKYLGLNDRIEIFNHLVTENSLLPDCITGQFDAIISNPPYVKTKDLLQLQPEIKLYENLNALDGGPDGLKIAKILLKLAKDRLIGGGKLWMELDPSHPEELKKILKSKYKDTLEYVSCYKDVFGKDRYVEIRRK